MTKGQSKQKQDAASAYSRFETQSLYQAAFCYLRGLKLIDKRQEGTKVTLIFEGVDARRIAMGFYDHGSVEAKAYADAYRSIKDFCFER